MIRSRPKPKVRRGPAPPSDDPYDKMMAALQWYVGRYKTDSTYVTAPHYFDQLLKWFEALSLDNQELAHTVHEVYTRSGWGERIAEKYASDLPAVPRYPFRADK